MRLPFVISGILAVLIIVVSLALNSTQGSDSYSLSSLNTEQKRSCSQFKSLAGKDRMTEYKTMSDLKVFSSLQAHKISRHRIIELLGTPDSNVKSSIQYYIGTHDGVSHSLIINLREDRVSIIGGVTVT
jgi:hypothetical protein